MILDKNQLLHEQFQHSSVLYQVEKDKLENEPKLAEALLNTKCLLGESVDELKARKDLCKNTNPNVSYEGEDIKNTMAVV